VGAAHWRQGETGGAAHIDGRVAGEALQPEHVLRAGKDDVVAFLVGDGRRRRTVSVDEEGAHLQLWKGAAHPVAVDDGQPRLRAGDHRLHRVGAADLARDQSRRLGLRGALDGAQGLVALVALLDLLDADDRRADPADADDHVVVAQLVEGQQPEYAPALEQLLGAQPADVGVASAAGPQDGGAQLQGADVVDRERPPPVRTRLARRLYVLSLRQGSGPPLLSRGCGSRCWGDRPAGPLPRPRSAHWRGPRRPRRPGAWPP